jgi:ubiquinone/menaquinone biosynthesis C-methylase UbiE
VRRDQGDDHEGLEAHARHRGSTRRGRAGGRSRHRLSLPDFAGLFDRAAATYDVAAFPFFTPFGEALVEFADIGAEERVLDVGCGTGAVLAPAARVAASACGIELSPGMAERARAAVPEAEVVVGDASSPPFADASFDVILSGFTVFFMPDPTAALTEWRRVLAPDGRLAASTWLAPDPRWDWERDVRKEFMHEIPSTTLEQLGWGMKVMNRFDDREKVEGELRAAGFEPSGSKEHSIEFVFEDEQAWWDWSWSHGTRVVLEALPEPALERFRERAFEAMQAMREENGFPRRYTALFTSASVSR